MHLLLESAPEAHPPLLGGAAGWQDPARLLAAPGAPPAPRLHGRGRGDGAGGMGGRVAAQQRVPHLMGPPAPRLRGRGACSERSATVEQRRRGREGSDAGTGSLQAAPSAGTCSLQAVPSAGTCSLQAVPSAYTGSLQAAPSAGTCSTHPAQAPAAPTTQPLAPRRTPPP